MAEGVGKAVEPGLIDFRDRDDLAARRPLVIAHRGGVVSPASAECSQTAIGLAAEQGYDMVELDVQRSRDGIPMVFHDRSLLKSCGRDGRVEAFTALELEGISYLVGSDRIIRLETALGLCRALGLGVMLDLKVGRDSLAFLTQIEQMVLKTRLENATISFSGSDLARQTLKSVRFTPTGDEMRRLREGESLDLGKRFWFGLPKQLQPGDVERLKKAGSLILPAINTFRYPSRRHDELAREDIKRLTAAGVDGFQIDSIYLPHVPGTR